jgi:hypothetical protein
MINKDQILLENAYGSVQNFSDYNDQAEAPTDAPSSSPIAPDEPVIENLVRKLIGNYRENNFKGAYQNGEVILELINKHLRGTTQQHESTKIPHGVQPISEAKKKVNPWAIEKSIEKKTGKTFGKKHKEEIIKGIKKSAKKSGKKITSDKVKPSKK